MVDPNLSPGDWIQGQVLKWHTGLDQDGGGVTIVPGPPPAQGLHRLLGKPESGKAFCIVLEAGGEIDERERNCH